jgi:AmiR/NasT family two-component response regulator
MKSLRRARIVIVAEEVGGRALLSMLQRVELPQVTVVESAEEARLMCEAGGADVCVVSVRNYLLEEPAKLTAETAAPAAPSVLLADIVTPDVTETALRSGYASAVTVNVAPRILYRLIGAAMQKARRRPTALRVRGTPCTTPTLRTPPNLAVDRLAVSPWTDATVDLAKYGPWTASDIDLGKIKLSS